MAAILLPDAVVPRDMEHWFVDAGGWQRGRGAAVRIDRLGSRYGVALQFPPFQSRDVGRIAVSRLIRAQRLGLRVELPLGDFDPGIPGSPVVDGDGQAGTTLAVTGFTPNYAIREGQWFTHIRGDDALLYNVAAPTIANGSGEAELTIEPELRLEPEDGDVLLFGRPVIQGMPMSNERRWRMAIERLTSFEVEIEEVV